MPGKRGPLGKRKTAYSQSNSNSSSSKQSSDLIAVKTRNSSSVEYNAPKRVKTHGRYSSNNNDISNNRGSNNNTSKNNELLNYSSKSNSSSIRQNNDNSKSMNEYSDNMLTGPRVTNKISSTFGATLNFEKVNEEWKVASIDTKNASRPPVFFNGVQGKDQGQHKNPYVSVRDALKNLVGKNIKDANLEMDRIEEVFGTDDVEVTRTEFGQGLGKEVDDHTKLSNRVHRFLFAYQQSDPSWFVSKDDPLRKEKLAGKGEGGLKKPLQFFRSLTKNDFTALKESEALTDGDTNPFEIIFNEIPALTDLIDPLDRSTSEIEDAMSGGFNILRANNANLPEDFITSYKSNMKLQPDVADHFPQMEE